MEPTREQVVPESRWTYKDKEYVIGSLCRTKDAGDGNWYDGVAYYPAELAEAPSVEPENLYVRRLDDFLAKFRPVDPSDCGA